MLYYNLFNFNFKHNISKDMCIYSTARATLSTKRSYVLCELRSRPSVTWRSKGHCRYTLAVTNALHTVRLKKCLIVTRFIIYFWHRDFALCTALRRLSSITIERNLSGQFSPLTAPFPFHEPPSSRSAHSLFGPLRSIFISLIPLRSYALAVTTYSESSRNLNGLENQL